MMLYFCVVLSAEIAESFPSEVHRLACVSFSVIHVEVVGLMLCCAGPCCHNLCGEWSAHPLQPP